MQALDVQQRLAAVLTTLLFALQAPLGNPQFALGCPIMLGRLHAAVITVVQEVLDVQINAHRFPCWRKRRWVGEFAGKTYKPLARLLHEAHRLEVAFQRPMPAHPQATYCCDLQAFAIQPKAVAILFQAKTVEAVVAFEAWITRLLSSFHPAEEVLEGCIALRCCHLQNVAVNVFKLPKGRFVALDQPQLVVLGDTPSFQFPGVLALRHTHVVPVARRIQTQPQLAFLRWRGIQAVFERLQHHAMRSCSAKRRMAISMMAAWLMPSFCANAARRRLASPDNRMLVACFFLIPLLYTIGRYDARVQTLRPTRLSTRTKVPQLAARSISVRSNVFGNFRSGGVSEIRQRDAKPTIGR